MTSTPASARVHVDTLVDDACFARRPLHLAGENLSGTSRDGRWQHAICQGLRLRPYLLQATSAGEPIGELPLALLSTRLFGRFLVSLPYVNSAGLVAADTATATALLDAAVQLANRLDVRYVELRHECELEHAHFAEKQTQKVHMRLPLPGSADALWKTFHPKVRNQIRKGEKNGFGIVWGGIEQLDPFYDVFARNMRDLGTPVYPQGLFREILDAFGHDAELCLVRDGERPIAGALLVHEAAATEVPSASSLRSYNASCANMLMYWQLLQRAIERRQPVFDFGRSSAQSNTFRFKKQWGAQPEPAVWQYYLRQGAIDQMRPDSPKYRRKIWVWQHLPVWLTRWIGPAIVRGIP